jgi:hypothetical protein
MRILLGCTAAFFFPPGCAIHGLQFLLLKGAGAAMKTAHTLILTLFLCMACYPVHASEIESYHYVENEGQVKKEILWCVHKAPSCRLLFRSNDEKDLTRTDGSFATLEWEMEKTGEDTFLHARRQADTIIIEGKLKGAQIRKELSIDEAPWYQATSWSLRPFILSADHAVRFWTIREDNLRAYKIKAVKKSSQTLNLGTGKVAAIQVELRLTGLLAPFWKCAYWFRSGDGVFMRFEGPSGPPGSPYTVIEYRGPAAPCGPAVPPARS